MENKNKKEATPKNTTGNLIYCVDCIPDMPSDLDENVDNSADSSVVSEMTANYTSTTITANVPYALL